MSVASAIQRLLGPDSPVTVEAYDGSTALADDPAGTLVIHSPDALRRFVTSPGELGVVRAYVAGDIDLDGDLFSVLSKLVEHRPRADPKAIAELARAIGPQVLKPIPPPPEEIHLRGLRHTRRRDAKAVTHHYDVSNDFYRHVLGPSMTYSSAVWDTPATGLDAAQAAKAELICQKLALQPGMRLLDVGCGWGSLAMHAAAEHGATVIGVTISPAQAELATRRVKEAGLEQAVDIRLQDYRDVDDGPFDAISSVGMFEHVGRARLAEYFGRLHGLLGPGGRLLNHGISRPPYDREAWPVHVPSWPLQARTLIARYIFPDGELHEVGQVVSTMQLEGFEVRHVESLREHYALTLRAWVANLERNWDAAVADAGLARARVWRLYMVATAVAFELGHVQIHQVLGARSVGGASGFPLRPAY